MSVEGKSQEDKERESKVKEEETLEESVSGFIKIFFSVPIKSRKELSTVSVREKQEVGENGE